MNNHQNPQPQTKGGKIIPVSTLIGGIPLPIMAYQRRSLRVFTLWIKREKPGYYRHYMRQDDFNKPDTPFRRMWNEEREFWRGIFDRKVNNQATGVRHIEVTAVYPAQNWIHLTVEFRGAYLKYPEGGIDKTRHDLSVTSWLTYPGDQYS